MEQLSKLIKRRLGNHNLNESAKSSEVLFAANEWFDKTFDFIEIFAHILLLLCKTFNELYVKVSFV